MSHTRATIFSPTSPSPVLCGQSLAPITPISVVATSFAAREMDAPFVSLDSESDNTSEVAAPFAAREGGAPSTSLQSQGAPMKLPTGIPQSQLWRSDRERIVYEEWCMEQFAKVSTSTSMYVTSANLPTDERMLPRYRCYLRRRFQPNRWDPIRCMPRGEIHQ